MFVKFDGKDTSNCEFSLKKIMLRLLLNKIDEIW